MSGSSLRSLLALALSMTALGACGACSSTTANSVAPSTAGEVVVAINAKKFAFSPNVIHVKKGQSVVFELTSSDRLHGFRLADFGIREDIKPGTTTRVSLVADKTGTFVFSCDVFCGDGHDGMSGQLIVE